MRYVSKFSANVIPIILKQKFKKGSFYCPFFLSELKIFNEVYNECSMKFNFKNKTLREVEITKIIDATQKKIMLKFKYSKLI